MVVHPIGTATCTLVRAAARAVTHATSTTCRVKNCIRVRNLSSGSTISSPTGPSCRDLWPRPRIRAPKSPLYQLCCRRSLFTSQRVVRDYEDLPKDYRDQSGLSFSSEDLTEEEVKEIFGPGLSAAAGNRLLRILHGRRVAGTLEDPAFAIHTAQYPAPMIAQALTHLRKVLPVNEVLNAGLRAEDELNQMDREMAEREGQKSARGANEDLDAELDTDAKIDPVYGRSSFDQIRARNIAKQKAKDKAEEDKRLAKAAEEGAGAAGPIAKREDGTRAIANPKVAEYYEKAQSNLDAPPDMKAWERILPSATAVVLVLGFLSAVAMVYDEPMPRYRLLRDLSTSQATIGTLIAINALVFLGWRIPPLWSFFNKYMIFVVATVKPATLFTAMFSHNVLTHMLVNMVPLWFIGNALHEELGRADFLTLYFGCGALGFLGSLVTYTLRGWLTVTSLGASGATLGLCSAYFWEHRNDGFKILGLPQDGVHGIVFLAMIFAVQMAAFGRTAKLKVDIASHLSGMAAGILGIEIINRTARQKRSDNGKEVVEIWGRGGVPQQSGTASER